MAGYTALVTAERASESTHYYRWKAVTLDASSPQEYAEKVQAMLVDHKAAGTDPSGWDPQYNWGDCRLTKMEIFRDGESTSRGEPSLTLVVDIS